MRRSFPMPPLARFSVGLAALVALGGAAWVNPPSASNNNIQVEPQVSSAKGMPPAPPASVEPEVRQQAVAQSRAPRSSAQHPAAANQRSALDVVRWGFGSSLSQAQAAGAPSAVRAGQPLYLSMTIDGGQAAVERLRADGRLAVEVHWTRDGGGPGAPNLTTPLTVGHPGLAPIFAAQVDKDGHFQWHSWARKDNLSPGRWSVSLTYPDGSPVLCGSSGATQPCRFSLDAG